MKQKLYTTLLLISITLLHCTNPLQDVEIQVSTDIIHYSALLEVQDGKGNPVNDVTVNITGQDADDIYNLAGNKTFLLQGGIIGVGVHPHRDPRPDAPVKFNIELTGTGYLTQNIPVTMVNGRLQQVIKADVLRISDAPAGVAIATPKAALQGGTNAAEIKLETPVQNQTAEITTISLPAGTRFQNAEGNPISGSQLSAVIAHVDPAKEDAMNIFPGGSLIVDNVEIPGQGLQTGTFNPAGLVNIDMTVGGSEVKHFTQPITVAIQIDPSFTNLATGGPIRPGDVLGVYSYETGAAQWKYEGNANVQIVNGKPTVSIQTTHLTWFMVGNFVESCDGTQSLVLSGSWLTPGIKYPMTIDAMVAGRVVGTVQADITTKNNTVSMTNLPTEGVTIRVKNQNDEILAYKGIPDGCSGTNGITLNRPSVVNKTVTMQLYVRCPNNVAVIGVLPTFYLYYRVTKPTADVSGYKLLGVVEKGFISTTALTPGTVVYDFKAVWGDNVKYSHKKTVAADNSAVVGDGSGEIIGEIDPQNNLEMLKEKCKEFGL